MTSVCPLICGSQTANSAVSTLSVVHTLHIYLFDPFGVIFFTYIQKERKQQRNSWFLQSCLPLKCPFQNNQELRAATSHTKPPPSSMHTYNTRHTDSMHRSLFQLSEKMFPGFSHVRSFLLSFQLY